MISVIIPTHNRETFLKQCIASVLNQTNSEFEIIIIDDGSTDNTKKSVLNFNDKRISYYNYGRIANISKLRNRGICLSKGELIAFCDDDDYWIPNKLEKQLHYIGKYDFICSNAFMVDANSNILKDKYYENIDSNTIVSPEILLFRNHVITSTVLFKKQILDNVKLFDEEFYPGCGEDYEFCLNVSFKYKILFMKDSLVYYRLANNSLSSNKENRPRLLINMAKITEKYKIHEKKSIRKAAIRGIFNHKLIVASWFRKNKQYSKFFIELFECFPMMRHMYILKLLTQLFVSKFTNKNVT